MTDPHMPLEELLAHLEQLANESLKLWDLPSGAKAKLINVSENTTYLVETSGGYRSILRMHRENYHTRHAIECELSWLDALAQDGSVQTPKFYLGRNKAPIQEMQVSGLEHPRYLVMFHFLEGSAPDESGDMTSGYEKLGAIAAHCHTHALKWSKPPSFERLVWDIDAVFGTSPTWGNWRDAPEVTQDVRDILEQVEDTVRSRLTAYGKSPERYNLIHADMRLANLLVTPNETRLIDFDDCGYGWLMYDFAAAISFIEDDPRIPEFRAAWLRGYRSVRRLNAEDEAEIETFIMMRRMALLAWIGSHIEAPEPQKYAPGFAAKTAQLGKAWLQKRGCVSS